MADTVRIGRISSINYEKGTASVIYTDRNNEPSPNYPFFSSFYEMPKVDDTAVVILLSNSTSKGFILGIPWSAANAPERTGKGIFYKRFQDGAYVMYDPQKKEMVISAENIVLNSVTTDNLKVTGTATIENLTVTGRASGHYPD